MQRVWQRTEASQKSEDVRHSPSVAVRQRDVWVMGGAFDTLSPDTYSSPMGGHERKVRTEESATQL